MKFCIFDPAAHPVSRVVSELQIPDQLDPDTLAAQQRRAARLHNLRMQGEQLKRQITDPVARAGLRKFVSGV